MVPQSTYFDKGAGCVTLETMMDRPMTVEEALELYPPLEKCGLHGGKDWKESNEAARALADEVRRLRARIETLIVW